MTPPHAEPRLPLPEAFPRSDYTPFGYIDNPAHCAVLNRSGTIRTVPPLGFGFWCRQLPWPYGEGNLRPINYLSLLHLSVTVDGIAFHTADDFHRQGVDLVSRYHTKTLMSYDWAFRGLGLSAKYFLDGEHTLACVVELANRSSQSRRVTLHVANNYGMPERDWWGVCGTTAAYRKDLDAAVSKLWPYGDVFVLGADRASACHTFAADDDAWTRWVREGNETPAESGIVHFNFPTHSVPSVVYEHRSVDSIGHLYSVLRYVFDLAPGESDAALVCLSRAVNEAEGVARHLDALRGAVASAKEQLLRDEVFYRDAPVLTGDFSPAWKHGWIYDLETIRMNIRPPVGIFTHPWDAMQVHTPRQVLGETHLDCMCLSFADIELAKEVIYGTFADAPAPNVPCTREDGSMNMISATGSECGTAPIWGLPFHVIQSIYLRSGDDGWIRSLYPYLKAFLEWWMAHRTDEEGFFHANCSWESGQDCSRRFQLASDSGGDAAEGVRTVDIEAAMAEAFALMARFAAVAGREADVDRWRTLADRRLATTRSMYVDGWFRDFDARSKRPILLRNEDGSDYYDVMMLVPVACGIATEEQLAGIRPKFRHFQEHPHFWLEWPSFLFPYSEAAWNAGERDLLGEVVSAIGDRIYPRIDRREPKPVGRISTGLPDAYNYRIPGVATEFWPLEPPEENPGGCENYGWGATFPTLAIRNLIGFREMDGPAADRFVLAPAFPAEMARPGRTYGILNLHYRGVRADVDYTFLDARRLTVVLRLRSRTACTFTVQAEDGRALAGTDGPAQEATLEFEGTNGALHTVRIGSAKAGRHPAWRRREAVAAK